MYPPACNRRRSAWTEAVDHFPKQSYDIDAESLLLFCQSNAFGIISPFRQFLRFDLPLHGAADRYRVDFLSSFCFSPTSSISTTVAGPDIQPQIYSFT